jgi:hypothetical protein
VVDDAQYAINFIQRCDATAKAREFCSGERTACAVPALDGLCGDPAPGHVKTLYIRYHCGERSVIAQARQNTFAILSCQ